MFQLLALYHELPAYKFHRHIRKNKKKEAVKPDTIMCFLLTASLSPSFLVFPLHSCGDVLYHYDSRIFR